MLPLWSGSRFPAVHGVHHRDFLVKNDIGIVGHAGGHLILALKKINVPVEYAHIHDGIRNTHECSSLIVIGSFEQANAVYHIFFGK